MRTAHRRIAALAAMIAGTAGVFTLLYFMNAVTGSPAEEPPKQAVDFGTPPPPPKKEPPPPPPRRAPRKLAHTAPAAPMPNLTTALSGLRFDLPGFEASESLGQGELVATTDADKKLVMTEESVDSLPRPVSRKPPAYPARARQRGVQGHVTLKIKVSEDGAVEQVRVVDADPKGVFEQVAIAAVRQWTFEPARYKGSPVAVAVSQKIPFRLN
jgi:protein TonB